ncbi:MAG: MarR family transcriptional regulator [Chloroflexi bacterium]|nr:MarR family transcriptional regulator [Chloroflexota bacterium]
MSDKSSPNYEPGAPIDSMVDLIGSRLSTATVLFHSAIADRLGVSATDVKCYTILRQSGPISAGELAERVALTTGAITGVIDRLEKAQLVRRVPDPRDRRRVVLELLNNPEREQAILALYQPMGQAMIELIHGYSEAERALIGDFLTRATEILEAETLRLRQGAASPKL